MLNERQKKVMYHLAEHHNMKCRKIKKKDLGFRFKEHYHTEFYQHFNSTTGARTMSDDFLAITMDRDNPFIVVSSKSGVFISDLLADRDAYILSLRYEANAKHKLASDIARLPLKGQIRGVAL